ncbi:aminoacyl-tRNA deacylase [Celeribacter neptunius]|uniref:Cys-tRNA(Pro)/Cys-tRNA(Cys) deacylase n=1 Tax=Celeribacter neptunius TaxID=588602 RepID=A0A1I3W1Y0_9RHOB|nr:aminoacyl-tRNA deacylase [Celeribacter neptunius]SFK01183.1 Cys-tRNA(Pro)/Cys-tRNA(Cys) deacylase [Celeribacter neptunius]
MSTATPATRFLERAGLSFERLEYDYGAGGEGPIGLNAAEAIGWEAGRVFKTLMVELDGKPACAVLASNRSLSMKKLAAALKGKSAQMMDPSKAERLTGFHTGGISPFGQKKRVPIVFDATVTEVPAPVVINGGKRGLMVCLDPVPAIEALGAKVAAVSQ